MWDYAAPILFALFVWWFSTGAIIYLDGLPRKTFKWSMLGATAILTASLYGLHATAQDASVSGAYWAFTFGLLAWGWQEISFYMGYVTGPRKTVCQEGCSGWRHFLHAIGTSLYHELAIIASGAVVVWLTWGAPNQVGTWTFIVLWWMHQSAKLNVFLGVRNLNEEFLPEHLQFLRGFLKKKSMNLLFPVSVTVSTVIAGMMVESVIAAPAGSFESVAMILLSTMMILAILEHWFLVVPLPAAKLWHWGLKSRGEQASKPVDVTIAAGFLGAGKTTFLRRLMQGAGERRTVALVNDFGEMGIDASRLGNRGAEVVELPNGCICCSLRGDLAKQLVKVMKRYQPERILIEPSGVADVTSLLAVLNRPDIRPLLGQLHLYTLIDAAAFLKDYANLPDYFEMQAEVAPVFVINKTDLVGSAELATVSSTLSMLNPRAHVVTARFSMMDEALDPDRALVALMTAAKAEEDQDNARDHAEDHGAGKHHEDHAHHHDLEQTLGFTSWSTTLSGFYEAESLERLLSSAARGDYGEIRRLKGLAHSGEGWILFELAGGRSYMTAFAPQGEERARVMAIGKITAPERLKSDLEACALQAAE
ncbi:MAG: putative photosynthetic complex assembly protein PuhE [Limibacillus sp.]